MKLAEALAERADTLKHIGDLRSRLQRNAVTTEGDDAAEDIGFLLTQLDFAVTRYGWLIEHINRTNLATEVEPGVSLTNLLARRDALNQKLPVLQFLIAHTSNALNQHRQQRSELRAVSHVDVGAVQRQIDAIATELRRLDNTIQEKNWLTDLLG